MRANVGIMGDFKWAHKLSAPDQLPGVEKNVTGEEAPTHLHLVIAGPASNPIFAIFHSKNFISKS